MKNRCQAFCSCKGSRASQTYWTPKVRSPVVIVVKRRGIPLIRNSLRLGNCPQIILQLLLSTDRYYCYQILCMSSMLSPFHCMSFSYQPCYIVYPFGLYLTTFGLTGLFFYFTQSHLQDWQPGIFNCSRSYSIITLLAPSFLVCDLIPQ